MTEDTTRHPPATPPGPAHATPDDAAGELDALDQQAALLMGIGRSDYIGLYYVPSPMPDGESALLPLPSPTRDHGDCMRLLLHTARKTQSDTGDALRVDLSPHGLHGMSVDLYARESHHFYDTDLTAITRACVAALETAAASGDGEEREGGE